MEGLLEPEERPGGTMGSPRSPQGNPKGSLVSFWELSLISFHVENRQKSDATYLTLRGLDMIIFDFC